LSCTGLPVDDRDEGIINIFPVSNSVTNKSWSKYDPVPTENILIRNGFLGSKTPKFLQVAPKCAASIGERYLAIPSVRMLRGAVVAKNDSSFAVVLFLVVVAAAAAAVFFMVLFDWEDGG